MRLFFRLFIVVLFILSAVSIWVVEQKRQAGELSIQSLQPPKAETAVSTPADPAPEVTPEPTGVDTTMPQLVSIEISQELVDSSASDQPVTVTVQLVDDLSGLQAAALRFVPTVGGTQYLDVLIDASHLVSGDLRDGAYTAHAQLPQYSAHSRWQLVAIYLVDNANNSCGAPDLLYYPGQPLTCWELEETPYFVNGVDSGPATTATPTATPGPDLTATAEPQNAGVDEKPSDLQSSIFLPAIR